MKQKPWSALAATYALSVAGFAAAATVPFTEDFAADNANWKDASSADLTYVGSGGPDGSSYVTSSFTFDVYVEGDTPVLFRGQDDYGSSGGAFQGNWNLDGVRKLSAWVRHNATVPLSYFVRTSGPFNFPGATAVQFGIVLPNQWTEVEFDLSPSSPQFVSFEGNDWATVMSNIGHVQLGVSVPEALEGNPASFAFDIDQIAIATPEPTTIGLGLMGSILALGHGRLRRNSIKKH